MTESLLIIENGAGDPRLPPPHLANQEWLPFESKTARAVQNDLEKALHKLTASPNARNVHEARVVLRRWNSVWKVLKADGWETKKQKKEVSSELKAISRMLGLLRDRDVNIEVAESIGTAKQILNKWRYEREWLGNRTKKKLKKIDTDSLMQSLEAFLKKRPAKLTKQLEKKGISCKDSAYEHLEPFLRRQEKISALLAGKAKSPDALHRLRLNIKAWRYLLVEFYGLTNLQLVRAQQILGKLNDLHRISILLTPYDPEIVQEALSKLAEQQKKLLEEFSQIRDDLPFGLRPRVSTISPASNGEVKL